jgi:hypothetical protein
MDGATRPLAGGCLRDRRAPVEAAIETEKQVIAPFCEWKHNGRPQGIVMSGCRPLIKGFFSVARVVGAVMSSAFRAENWIRWP